MSKIQWAVPYDSDEVKKDLDEFTEAMKQEYLRHYPNQGDSWKKCDIEWLEKCATNAIWEIVTPEYILFETNPDHLLDIANFLAFIWIRYKSINNQEKR